VSVRALLGRIPAPTLARRRGFPAGLRRPAQIRLPRTCQETGKYLVCPGGMTLQNLGHPSCWVAAWSCKSGGGMVLQKPASEWRHGPANRHPGQSVSAAVLVS
jgi:hypothetical protein